MSDLKNFSSALKCYVPDNIKLENGSIKLMHSILCKINTNFVNAIVNASKAEKLQVIDAKTTQKAIETLIPENFKRHALANVSRDICLYSSGVLEYEAKVIKVKHVTIDFKDPVKRILADFNSIAARGFLPQINDHLNDLCYALAAKSSENAKNNNSVLTEKDVFFATNELLPPSLRQHAFARICQVQKQSGEESELPVQTGQTQKKSSWSLLSMAKNMIFSTPEEKQPAEEQDKKVNVDEKKPAASFMDMAWGWFSSSSAEQTEAKETEQTGSEDNESLKPLEK